MITEVLDKNVVPIPEQFVLQHGIKPGVRLEWNETAEPDVFRVKVLPDYAALATSLMGAGRKHIKEGMDPIADLVNERCHEETDRQGNS